MHKLIFTLLILIFILSVPVFGFYIASDFTTEFETGYKNQSVASNCWMWREGVNLWFNGSSCGSGSTGTFITNTAHSLSANTSGYLAFTFMVNQSGDAIGNAHFQWGLITNFAAATNGVYLSIDTNPGTGIYLAKPGARLTGNCQPTYQPINTLPHNVILNATRGLNGSTGINTTYQVMYDGSPWCNVTIAAVPVLYLNFTDTSASSNHTYIINSFAFTDNDYSSTCDTCECSCVAKDTFNRLGDLGYCGWNLAPNVVIPTGTGQICYTAGSQPQEIDFYTQTQSKYNPYADSGVYLVNFDVNLASGSSFEHKMDVAPPNSFDLIDYSLKAIPYTFVFWNDGVSSYVQYMYYDPALNVTGFESLCTNCTDIASKFNIQVKIYSPNATGYTFWNDTSNAFEAIMPNSVTLVIDNVSYPNIPSMVSGAVLPVYRPYKAYFTWVDGKVCLSNFEIFNNVLGDERFDCQTLPGGILPDHLYLYGQACNSNEECLTHYCLFGLCKRKNGGESCNESFGYEECYSRVCANGKCTSSDLWSTIDTAKSETFGNTSSTNSFIALFIIIAAAVGLTIWSGKIEIGAISYVALFFFFSAVGWMNIFIILGHILFAVVIVMFKLISGGGQ